jgi:hypothetical protein
MSSNLRLSVVTRMGSLAVSAIGLLTMPAAAGDLVTAPAAVHVADPGVLSDAQLAEQLRAAGYTDIKLTSERPTQFTPRPEISAAVSEGEAPATAAHPGWNGTALKDGRTVDIYVDPVNLRAASKGQ